MSPANKSVSVFLSCFFECVVFVAGAAVCEFSAGSFLIFDVVPQAERSTVKRMMKKTVMYLFLFTVASN